jgi:predicted acetyltransferase
VALTGIGASSALAFWGAPTIADTSPTPLTTTASLAKIVAANVAAASAPTASLGLILNTAPVTYSRPLPLKTDQVAWSVPPSDAISRLMEVNLSTPGDSSLLKGLGAALLDRFATTQSDFQQSAVDFEPSYSNRAADGSYSDIKTTAADALQYAKNPPNNVSLKLHLVSGKEVDISVSFGSDGKAIQKSLSVDVHTSGKLTAAEQTAIAQLSKGFEAALQGVSQGEPKIDVSGLVNFDPSVLSAVDLTVRAPPPPPYSVVSPGWDPLLSLDFHADAAKRSLAVKTLAGSVSVNVDLSQSAFLGTTAQQQTAVQRYLDQFDAANKRGHGDTVSVAEFKDAFAQLNSSYPPPGRAQPKTLNSSALSDQDHSVLSGVADFQASMSVDFNNAMAKESGHIDYQVSQSTQSQGSSKAALAVVQTQGATLTASYAKNREGAEPTKGSYDIFRVNDSSSTITSFEYAKDKLKTASITSVANQLDQYEKLVHDKVVERKDTPANRSTVRDISAEWPAAARTEG